VERAVNQALILLLFGITLSVSLLAKSLRDYLRLSLRRDIIALPAILTGFVLVSLSGEVSRLHAESDSFDAFRKESAARELFLTTSQETVVTVKKHFWKPSIIMNSHADIDQSTGCVALYYGKSKIIPTEAASP
jgi:hypothetical protein